MGDFWPFLVGVPYYACPDCADNGHCMLYGHYCGNLQCNGKPEAFQPPYDKED